LIKQKDKMKKVLIIGGSSSICDEIISYLEEHGYEIDMLTYRDDRKIYGNYNWQHLDLTNKDSVENFINILPDQYYDKVICVPTYNSGGRNPFITSREYLSDLFGNFTINYMILIRSLFKKITKNGHIVYISTASANMPTDMVDYSAAKGALQNYVRSLSKKVTGEQVIFSIAPTMIYESAPYYQHLGIVPKGHKEKTLGGYPLPATQIKKEIMDPKNENYNDTSKLVRKKEIAKIIVDAGVKENGKIICLGFKPALNDFEIR